MNLRSKVLLILAGMWFIIFLTILAASKIIILERFNRLEVKNMTSEIHSTKIAFDNLKYAVGILSDNWGLWDEAYTFMSKKNEKFISDNFDPIAMRNAKLNIIFFYDTNNQLYFGRYYDLIKDKFMPIPQDLLLTIKKENILNNVNDKKSNNSGVINTPYGMLIFSISSILHSNGSGPSQGKILMGYYFTAKNLKELNNVVQKPIYFYNLNNKIDPAMQPIYNSILKGENYIQLEDPNNADTMNAFTPITNTDNKAIAMFKISEKRGVRQEVISMIKYYLSVIISLGVIVSVLVWYLLKYFVLNRIIGVSNQLSNINNEAKFSHRITISGNDELNNMVVILNNLLELIELTQEQLTSRISQRTEKLDRLLELNKNLFLEVNKEKSVKHKMRQDEDSLRKIAYYDNLTGLPNRIFFNELLNNTLKKSKNSGAGFAVMFLDIDKFKQINDTYGHDIGDKLLKHVAQQLKHVVKDSDIAARLAGDEFIVLLNNVKDKVIINLIAEKILKSVGEAMKEDNITIKSSFSIGISIFPDNGTTCEELLRSADLAMYQSKSMDGNTYRYAGDIKMGTNQ